MPPWVLNWGMPLLPIWAGTLALQYSIPWSGSPALDSFPHKQAGSWEILLHFISKVQGKGEGTTTTGQLTSGDNMPCQDFLRQEWTSDDHFWKLMKHLPFEMKMNDGWDCKRSTKISWLLLLQFLMLGVYQEMNNTYVCFSFCASWGHSRTWNTTKGLWTPTAGNMTFGLLFLIFQSLNKIILVMRLLMSIVNSIDEKFSCCYSAISTFGEQ